MLKIRAAWCGLVFFIATSAMGQVVSPLEIKDPELRTLQAQNMDGLKLAGRDILAIQFDYPFYLSRKLDLDQTKQEHGDQRSVRFDTYSGKTVIAITGNYYAAYSTTKMNAEQRARNTFLNTVLPVLQAVVPHFQSNKHVQGYAVEVSHHITGKTMGVAMERPENLMVYLPQSAAIRLLASKDDVVRQAALMQGQVFLNAQPVDVWISGVKPLVAGNSRGSDKSVADKSSDDQSAGPEIEIVSGGAGAPVTETASSSSSKPSESHSKPKEAASPIRDLSSEALLVLQNSNQSLLDQMVKEQDPLVHFVSYAPPKFVAFREGIYLELSLNSGLSDAAAGSRYKLAAMAFDDHIAHLIRPLLNYFRTEQQFDGIGFSTTVHLPGKPAANSSEAVEFYLPLSTLRCYEKYDCTGQQLLDAGTVLINGERVSLNLQIAEGGGSGN